MAAASRTPPCDLAATIVTRMGEDLLGLRREAAPASGRAWPARQRGAARHADFVHPWPPATREEDHSGTAEIETALDGAGG